MPLSSLSLVFTRRAGFPVYQTWFALRTQDLTGTVAVASGTCAVTATTVEVLRTDGSVVATTHPLADGSWSVPGLPASPDWTVALAGVPDTCQVVGPVDRTVDLSAGDATADFTVRQITTAAVEGTVRDSRGEPVPDVTVTLSLAGGATTTVTTGPDGRYSLDRLDPGDWTVAVTVPDGYRGASPTQRTFTVGASSTTLVRDQDFALGADPTVTGSVEAGGDPVLGAVVELSSGGVVFDRVVTGADGAYAFERVPPGSYSIAVPDPPEGYRVPAPQGVTVGTVDSPAHDFSLTRPGLVAGTVSLDGTPLSGVEVTVTGPSGTQVLTTDAAGRYVLDGLAPGGWTVTVTPPEGTTAGQTTRSVMVTAAGESFGSEDFDLMRSVTTTPTPPTTPPPPTNPSPATISPPTSGASGPGATLPDTGTAFGRQILLALMMLIAGAAMLTAKGIGRRR